MGGKVLFRAARIAAVLALVLCAVGPIQGSAAAIATYPQFWARMAPAGLGDPGSTSVSALAVYNNRLYAATINRTVGGSVWRYVSGSTWEPVAAPGVISTLANPSITDLIVFKGYLYAGTAWSDRGPADYRYQVWRYDETQWEKVLEELYPVHGFTTFAVYDDGTGQGEALYVGVSTKHDASPAQGARVMRSTTGAPGSWTTSLLNGNGNPNAFGITGMQAFGDSLYVAVADMVHGVQVWKLTGTTWSTEVSDGFGAGAANWDPGGFTVHGSNLYLGVRNEDLNNGGVSTGGKLYTRTLSTGWTPVTTNGFGNLNNVKIEGVVEYQGVLYALASNYTDGMQIWASTDGVQWALKRANGFGNPNNSNSIWTSAQAVYNGRLFIGTSDHSYSQGGEVWSNVDHGLFLPGVLR